MPRKSIPHPTKTKRGPSKATLPAARNGPLLSDEFWKSLKPGEIVDITPDDDDMAFGIVGGIGKSSEKD